jgi:hypothetical protein
MRSDNQLAFFKKFHQNSKYHFISNYIFLFVNIKNIRYNIIKKYETRMCLSIFLIIIYLIIIIFNIYNSIYLSNKLKIADDPENGGKGQNM